VFFHLHPATGAALAENSAVCTPPLKLFPSRSHKNKGAQFILPLSLLRPLGIKVTNTAPCFERRVGWAAAYRFSP
jgi:hypothetical protein